MPTVLPAPIALDIARALGGSDGFAGAIIAAGAMPGIISVPILGMLSDRWGRRNTLVGCLIASGVFGLAQGTATSLTVFFIFRIGQALGAAALINLVVVVIADYWDGDERGRLIGRNAAVITAAIGVLPALGGVILQVTGRWQAHVLLYSLGFIAAYAVWLRLPPPREGARAAPSTTGRAVPASATSPRLFSPLALLAVLLGAMFFVLVFGLKLTALPILLERRFDLGPGQRGFIVGLPALVSTPTALLLGALYPRIGRRGALIGGTSAYIVATLAFGWVPAMGVVVVAALVFGLGDGLALPTVQEVAAGAAAPANRGAVISLAVTGTRVGQSIGPIIVGGLIVSPITVGAVFLCGTALASLLLVIVLVAVRTRVLTV
ncbi:MAG: MFS transporter [Actinobacteria bacterium]|nr:MFS transporter [Actinomycetota bacterium]